MNREFYEATRPVRGRGPEKIEGHWFINFADIHPRSFTSMMLGGYASFFMMLTLYLLYIY